MVESLFFALLTLAVLFSVYKSEEMEGFLVLL